MCRRSGEEVSSPRAVGRTATQTDSAQVTTSVTQRSEGRELLDHTASRFSVRAVRQEARRTEREEYANKGGKRVGKKEVKCRNLDAWCVMNRRSECPSFCVCLSSLASFLPPCLLSQQCSTNTVHLLRSASYCA